MGVNVRLLAHGVYRWLPITMIDNEVVAEFKYRIPDLVISDID